MESVILQEKKFTPFTIYSLCRQFCSFLGRRMRRLKQRFYTGNRYQVARQFLCATWLIIVGYPFCFILSWLRIGIKKLLGMKPSVVWGPLPILSIIESSKLLNSLGYTSKTVVYCTYYITKDFDYDLSPHFKNLTAATLKVQVIFLWTLCRFDIFHHFYDGGFWSAMKMVPQAKWLELPLMRLAGKRVVVSAYGADVRLKEANEKWQPWNICRECPEPGRHCICTNDKKAWLDHWVAWSNKALAMGDMGDFVFRADRDFIYWPIDVKKIDYVGVQHHQGPVIVAHSPNHKHFKGTRFLEDAVRSLRNKGLDVNLDIIQGVSNQEARRRYAAADIVFAQCLAGWTGFTEIEAMAAGKPVMTFIRSPQYIETIPGWPCVNADAEHVEKELERLILDPDLRIELGQKGREYIEKYWSFEALASKYDNFHQSIWKNNSLLKTLRQRRRVFTSRDHFEAAPTPNTQKLNKWPVSVLTPFDDLQSIKRGIYGQPPFAHNDMPRFRYNGTYVEHPGVVALTALTSFSCMKLEPDSAEHMLRFKNCVTWLRDNLRPKNQDTAAWEYNFACLGRETSVPWVSCFTQGFGLSMLLRAAQLFPEDTFWDAASRAANFFQVPMAEGGFLFQDGEKIWLEEYPEQPTSHVLNGWVSALLSLNEYYRVTGVKWAGELFDSSVATLIDEIPKYTVANGIRYCLRYETVVNEDYFGFQIAQMEAMHKVTSNDFFAKQAKFWYKMGKKIKRQRLVRRIKFGD
jgi:hypothetical protein